MSKFKKELQNDMKIPTILRTNKLMQKCRSHKPQAGKIIKVYKLVLLCVHRSWDKLICERKLVWKKELFQYKYRYKKCEDERKILSSLMKMQPKLCMPFVHAYLTLYKTTKLEKRKILLHTLNYEISHLYEMIIFYSL